VSCASFHQTRSSVWQCVRSGTRGHHHRHIQHTTTEIYNYDPDMGSSLSSARGPQNGIFMRRVQCTAMGIAQLEGSVVRGSTGRAVQDIIFGRVNTKCSSNLTRFLVLLPIMALTLRGALKAFLIVDSPFFELPLNCENRLS
jgi:hypothetical protein